MWATKSKGELIAKLNSSENGLTSAQVEERLKKNGENCFPKTKKKNLASIYFSQFKGAIILILLVATLASIIIGETMNAIFIGAVIIINSIIGTFQEYNAEKSAEKLQDMIKVSTTVFRDGEKALIDSSQVVVGDIVFLETGNKIPADIRLIECDNLIVDESILTGESNEILKNDRILSENKNQISYSNMVYAGTLVLKGRAVGIVVETGLKTELGKIAHNVVNMKSEQSPLVIRINRFTKQISILFTMLIVVLSFILYFKGYVIKEIFFSVIALTVSAIPEGLSTAMTISLSFSSKRMIDKNVIVKKLNSVESLGSCTVIASDKTGTLTVNEQTAKVIVFPWGEHASISGEGYNDYGKIEYDRTNKNLDRRVGFIVKQGFINNEANLTRLENKWEKYGDSIDIAFKSLGLKHNIDISNCKLLAQVPYESANKYSATYYSENGKRILSIKGATETILDFCSKMTSEAGIVDINKEKVYEQLNELTTKGYRVIALAYTNKDEFSVENVKDDFIDLTFLGLVGFIDPVRPDAERAVKECLDAGIKVYMITGDHPNTAYTIGKKIKLVNDFSEVASGDQIDEEFNKGIENFDNFIRKIRICARVSPLQKLQIVESLKRQGEFVAVTGDGVNDAPALKSANIGIAMGGGTDLAKETGDMIIADDNFASIVEGVKEGRVAYNNIRSVIYMLLSTGFAEVILYVLSILCGMPFPLLAVQFLWLNLITNGIESNAMAFEKQSGNVMQEKIKKTNEQIFNKLFIYETLISSFVMALLSFVLYFMLYSVLGLDIVLVRTYLLTFMVFIEDVHVFNCRSEKLSAFKVKASKNKVLIGTIIFSIIVQTSFIFIPAVANVFGMTSIPLSHIGLLLLSSCIIIVVMEVFKLFLKTSKRVKQN